MYLNSSWNFHNLMHKNIVYWMGCETCNGQSMMLARGRNSWSMGDHKNRRSSGDLGNRLKINFLPVNCPLLLHLFFIDHKILPNIWYQYQNMVTSKSCNVLMSEHRISSSKFITGKFLIVFCLSYVLIHKYRKKQLKLNWKWWYLLIYD